MAKSRKTSRKTGARKKAVRRPARARAARKKIELRPIRRQLEAHKKTLRGVEQTREIKNAIRRLERCLAEIEGICGPNMMIPIS